MLDTSAFLVHPKNISYLKGEKPYPSSILNRYDLGCSALFLTFFVVLTIGLVTFMTKTMIEEVMLLQNSTATQGTVTEREIDMGDDSDTYWLSYFFYVDDMMYEGRTSVSQELYDKHPKESRIEITYVITDPSISRPSEHNSLPLNIFLGIFTVIWTTTVIAILFGVYKSYRKNNHLKKNGQLVKGQIINATNEIDGDDNFIMQLTLTFRTPDTAQTRTENHKSVANHLKNQDLPSEKTPIYIFYANQDNWQVL